MGAGVITVTGPSGSGKTSFCRFLLTASVAGFEPIVISKYTTRIKRVEEAVADDDYREKVFVNRIPEKCDIVYELYGERYGVQMEDLFKQIRDGRSPIVVLNDVRAVEDVRQAFGVLVRSVYLFRANPNHSNFKDLAKQRGHVRQDEEWNRYQKALSIYRIFTENIHLFDHIVLNVGSWDDLHYQATQVARGLNQRGGFWPLSEVQL